MIGQTHLMLLALLQLPMYTLATRHRQTLKVEPVENRQCIIERYAYLKKKLIFLNVLFCVVLEHQLVPAYFDVKMRARYAKCVHVGRSASTVSSH